MDTAILAVAKNVFMQRTQDQFPVFEEVAARMELPPFGEITLASLYDYFGSWEAIWQAAEIGLYYNRYANMEYMSEDQIKFILAMKNAFFSR